MKGILCLPHAWCRFSRKQRIQFPGQGDPENHRKLISQTYHITGLLSNGPVSSLLQIHPFQFIQGNCREPGKNSFIDCCNPAETNSSADSLCHKTEVACFSSEFKLRNLKPGKDPVCILLYSLLLKKPWRSKGALHLCALHPSHELPVLPRGLASHQHNSKLNCVHSSLIIMWVQIRPIQQNKHQQGIRYSIIPHN